MNWTIEEKVFLAALASLTYYEDDMCPSVDEEEERNYLEDISSNNQVTNVLVTDENVVISGRRICETSKLARKTHVRAQRVKIKPEDILAFRKSANNYRLKTKVDNYKEVQRILATIQRHQGKKEQELTTKTTSAETPPKVKKTIPQQQTEIAQTGSMPLEKPQTVLPQSADMPPEIVKPIQQQQTEIAQTVSIPLEKPQTVIPQKVPQSSPSQPAVKAVPLPETKPATPIQKAIIQANNGMNSTEFQIMQYIERIDKKHGTNLLQLLNSKCPKVDKVYKAAKEVEKRNEQKNNPKPALQIPLVKRDNPRIFNRTNHVMSEVEDGSIDFVFTSNPYWNQIEYLNPEKEYQLGQEPTIELFIEHLMPSYTEVHKKMAPTGNLLVNHKGTFDREGNYVGEEEFVIAMRQMKWKYKGRFIWLKKGGGKRSGNRTRNVENCYEPVYWFTKTTDYYYNPIEIPSEKPIIVTFKSAETRIESKGVTVYDKLDVSLPFTTFKNVVEETNFLDVVVSNSAATDSQFMNELYGKHPAPFPMALPLLFLLQFCPPNGRVLEPFLGRGAGLVSPLMLGHTCYGYEIEAEYFGQAQKLLADVIKDIDYYRERMKEIELQYRQKFNIAA